MLGVLQKEPSEKDSSHNPYCHISVHTVYVVDKTFSLHYELEYQETENSKQDKCSHCDAGYLIYESKEAGETYDGYRSPYG